MVAQTNTSRLVLHPQDFSQQTIRVGDLNMNVVVEGDKNAPLVVLLHGFPEFWYSWRHQIIALREAGYRVAAPDQRGYNRTDKTPPYDVYTLTKDVIHLIRALGHARATVIGHDWGGGIAWLTAAFYPDVVSRLVVCNCPHPLAIGRVLQQGFFPQALRSWYMGFFLLPELPERLLAADNYRALARNFNDLSEEELNYFREAWAQPGALSAGIAWYRQMIGRGYATLTRRDTNIRIPAHLVWGTPDPFLDKRVAEASRHYCPHLEIRYIEGGGHFVQQEAPEATNTAILEALDPV
jgi:epoxide hydrolase 4